MEYLQHLLFDEIGKTKKWDDMLKHRLWFLNETATEEMRSGKGVQEIFDLWIEDDGKLHYVDITDSEPDFLTLVKFDRWIRKQPNHQHILQKMYGRVVNAEEVWSRLDYYDNLQS